MSKRCPHCDGEIMPSVVKCRHCGNNISDPPQPRPEDPAAAAGAVQPAGQGEAAPSPIAAAVEAALDPTAPPAGVAFKPPVAVVPVQTPVPTPAPVASAASAVMSAAPPSDVQDWGAPVDGKKITDPYWQVKRTTQASAAGVAAEVRPPSDPKAVVAAVLLLAAGAVGIAASLQPWIDSSSSGLKGVTDEVIRGFSGWAGKATVALGVACILLALMSFVQRSAGSLKISLVAGLGIVAVGVYTLLTATSQVQSMLVTAREVEGMREDAARGLVAGWLDSGALKVTPQMWLFVAIAAGVVAVIGGIVAMSVNPASGRPAKGSRPEGL